MWRKERELAEQKEKMMQKQRAAKNQMQQNWLREQMHEKEIHSLEADHTPLEVQLNHNILAKIPALAVVSETRQRSRELHQREKEAMRNNKSGNISKPSSKNQTRK